MMFKRFSRTKKKRPVEIYITPMIDIMTALMAVFMITAPLLTSGIDLDLPEGGKSVLSKGENSLDINVNNKSEIFIGKNKISRDDLKKHLTALRKENPKLTVVISSDRLTPYGNVVAVMGMVRDAGFANVGLKTNPSPVVR